MPRKHFGGTSTRSTWIVALTILFAGFFHPSIISAMETYNRHEDLFAVSFPNETEGWACGDWGVIWHTGDGGQTWKAQKSGTDSTFSTIIYNDSQTGWVVGNDRTIHHTTDGGQNSARHQSPDTFLHYDV
jgi:photosystem II stability/assembly factor-like uncharacterized protein